MIDKIKEIFDESYSFLFLVARPILVIKLGISAIDFHCFFCRLYSSILPSESNTMFIRLRFYKYLQGAAFPF
jgi:hypothetical protein